MTTNTNEPKVGDRVTCGKSIGTVISVDLEMGTYTVKIDGGKLAKRVKIKENV